jgi:hypothetical protein
MALTSRERKIMIVAVAAVLILLLNQYAVSPIMEKRAEARQTRQDLEAKVEQSLSALNRRKLLQERWTQMQQNGLGGDIQKAESMVYRYIEDASARSGLELGSIQPDRMTTDNRLGEIDFVLSGTGSMQSVTRFLWSLETAQIPLKVKSYQLGSKNETAQEMTIQVELSTCYLKEEESQNEQS